MSDPFKHTEDYIAHAGDDITRRCFLFCGAAPAVAGVAMVAAEATSQQPEGRGDPKIAEEKQKTLRDPKIVSEVVKFQNGTDTIQGFLARPKKEGRFPAVLVVPGDFGLTEYTRVTAAELAQSGFVALGADVFSRASQIKDLEQARRVYFDVMTDVLTLQDLQAAIDYLKRQPFVQQSGVGVLGFCLGGRYSLVLGALSRDVAAGVAFYGPLLLLPGKADVKVARPVLIPGHEMSPLDFVPWIRTPVQGHYARKDQTIPVTDVQKFEKALRDRGTKAEMHLYDTDSHFHSYHEPLYNAEVAKLAWTRTLDHFRQYVK